MFKQFNKTIGDVHDATGIPRDGSGQRKIRNPLIRGDFGVKGEDWIKKGDYPRAPFGLTEEFFERYTVGVERYAPYLLGFCGLADILSVNSGNPGYSGAGFIARMYGLNGFSTLKNTDWRDSTDLSDRIR